MSSEPTPAPQKSRANLYVRSFITFVALAILTAVEFAVATHTNGSVAFLFILAVLKAALIVDYFMHVSHLWNEESH